MSARLSVTTTLEPAARADAVAELHVLHLRAMEAPFVVHAGLAERIRAHIDGLTERFNGSRIDYTLVNTSSPLDHALFSYLTTRERLTRVR